MTRISLLPLFLSILALLLTGANAQLTGDHFCNSYLCYYFTLDSTTQTAKIEVAASSNAGWLGLGIGSSRMAGADITIMWLAKNQSAVILSRRSTTAHNAPSVIADQSGLTLQKPASSYVANGKLIFTFSRPQSLTQSTLDKNQKTFIWAFSSASPSTDAVDSSFTRHTAFGSFTLDLTKSVSSSSNSTSNSSNTATSGPSIGNTSFVTTGGNDSSDWMKMAHGIIMAITWMLLIPSGIFVARFARHVDGWVKTHYRIQAFAAGVLTVVGCGFGFVISEGGHFDNPHQIIGLVIFLALALQIFLGWLIHHLFNPMRKRRPVRNYMHIFFGFGLFILAIVQVKLGIEEYGLSNGWSYAYYAYLAVLILVFIPLEIVKAMRRGREAQKVPIEEAGIKDESSTSE